MNLFAFEVESFRHLPFIPSEPFGSYFGELGETV